MASLDLKNPGGKEILIVGGAAAGLALIYFALSKSKSGTTPAPAASTGSTSATPSGVSGGSFGGTPLNGSLTGNVFQDIASSTPVSAPSSNGLGGPTGPPVRVPQTGVTQGAHAILGAGGASPGASPSPGGGGGTPTYTGPTPTIASIYQALVHAGLQPFQAAGVLGNIQNESLNSGGPEAVGDAGTSFGLVQWHSLKYNPRQYVTGNVAVDFPKQIKAIVAQFKSMNIGGTTAAQVAGNWASQFEGCVGCQPGGSQWSARMANASFIYQDALSGKFNPPKQRTKVSASAGTTAASAGIIAGDMPLVAAGTSHHSAQRGRLPNVGAPVFASVSRAFAAVTAAIAPKPGSKLRKAPARPAPKAAPARPRGVASRY